MSDVITGKVWKFGDGMDTDLMLPMHASVRPVAQQTAFVFEANRPGWVDEVMQGDVIIAGRFFGIGSGRPAAHVLRELGIAAVVADGVNGLFMRNAVNFGLPCFAAAGVSAIFDEGDVATIDLRDWTVRNAKTGKSAAATPLPDTLKDIMLTGGLRARLEAAGHVLPAGAAAGTTGRDS